MSRLDHVEPDSSARAALPQRVVFSGQWVAALLVPLLLFGARGWLGAPSGWLTTTGVLLVAPPVFLLLALPVMVVAVDPGPMRRRAVSVTYARASLVLWAALAVLVVTLPDPTASDSALVVVWSGGAAPAGAVAGLATIAAVVAVAAWASALAFAVSGFLAGRRTRPE